MTQNNKYNKNNNYPIGVFDSGVGGLNILNNLKKYLPRESFIYFGDTAHTPWGDQSTTAIQKYSYDITKFLISQHCKAVVIACNTASCLATDVVTELCSKLNIPVFNVIEPLIQETEKKLIKLSNPKIGVIGTTQTINSNIYQTKLQKIHPEIEIITRAAPVLCPLIEENLHQNDTIILEVLKHYLSSEAFLEINGLILACTHYHILSPSIADFYKLKNKIPFILEGGKFLAQNLQNYLINNNLANTADTADNTTNNTLHKHYFSAPINHPQFKNHDYQILNLSQFEF